jgi:DNA uptake protein ComE-like DNA-binding protein
MAERHWLDPLARRLLIATGQIQAPPATGGTGPALSPDGTASQEEAEERIERDLLALKLRQNPGLRLRHDAEVRRAAALGWRLDVNRATSADWRRLPGCTEDQVDLLRRLRAGGVQLSGPEDLQRLLELDDESIRCWGPLLEFRWYGDIQAVQEDLPDLNLAGSAELEARLPLLSPQRRQRLLRERQRSPFLDLADLQSRLNLPAAVVEELIGKVRFGRVPGGPSLPSRRPGRGGPR